MDDFKILEEKNGGNFIIAHKDKRYSGKYRAREKVYCKCGAYIDVYGARHSKRKRMCLTRFAIRCKRCGRLEDLLYSELELI